jgi:hypothetical protein
MAGDPSSPAICFSTDQVGSRLPDSSFLASKMGEFDFL